MNELSKLAFFAGTIKEKIYEIVDAKARKRISALETGKIDNAFIENGRLFLTANGVVPEDLKEGLEVGTNNGSGGGSGNNATMTISNTTGWISTVISDSEDCFVSFNWGSVENDMQTGNGSMNLKVNGTSKLVKTISQGDVSINIRDYLGTGQNIVRITVSDCYGNSRTLAMEVETIAFLLTSTFDDTRVYSGNITFPYTPTGSTTKTMQFILDGSLIGSAEITTSGRQQNFSIPVQPHGSHSLEVYFTANIGENVIESNHLYYDIIFEEAGNEKPIIASSFNVTKMTQYYTVSIPWLAYTPNSLTSDVVLYVNGEVYKNLPAVDRTKQVWTYRADTAGEVLLEVVTGTGELETRKQFNITVAAASIDVSAEENDLDLYLTSYGRSNSEENPAVWEYGNVSAQFDGFNWVSDGWQHDSDNNTVLRVMGDARVTIPLNVFGNDFRTTGKTIEFEFATHSLMDSDAVVMSCFSDNKGVVVTPNKTTLTSEQSTIFQRYNENKKIRISFVVDKKVENRLINLYIDGIHSGSVLYPESDDFQQGNPVGITIGSNDCGIDLYNIRVYSNNLTRYQMLDNWNADMQNGYDMVNAFNRNNIYDDYGQIVISKLPSDLPYLVLECPALPQYKGDKKTCSGYYVDPLNPEKSFRFEGATIDVQGTSSQYYARKNYKIKFSNGFIMEVSGETLEKYQMRDDSIPVNTFTFKADVASCEGANNVELVKLWNDICPYKTPPQLENGDVRQGIDGFPIVCFWSNGVETTFLGKYNFNNDKGTEEVFGFEAGDESWEIRNNTSMRSMFKSADFEGTDWLEDFEGRYPDGNKNPAKLKELAEWLVSTDQEQATGNALASSVTYEGVTYTNDTAAYRLAKFKAEADDWFEMDSIIFSYIFTELFLLVDSRAKNNFPTVYNGSKWCVLPYDMDTAMGTNNEGLLVFEPTLEDTDTVNGSNVYNGQDSVIYINTRDAFPDRIAEMYSSLRSDGVLSYEIVEKRFADHQALWSEAIFNEDAYFKYIQPLIDSGEATYLSMCQGSKASQRQWWLYNRFKYMDSKYLTGDALTNTVTLRAYQRSDVKLIPYADTYLASAFDSTKKKVKGKKNEVCIIIPPDAWNPNGSDAVLTIYNADRIKGFVDLSGFYIGYADFSKAINAQIIKLGDASPDYSNTNLTEVYYGNNPKLRIVDNRNSPNLAGNVDLSNCPNIEEAYFDGTSVTSVSLPNGGVLKILHLPNTIENLTLLNQGRLTDFVLPADAKLKTLWLENMGDIIDSFEILKAIPAGSRVRLIGVSGSLDNAKELVTLLSTMRGLDESGNNVDKPQISGTCHIEKLHISELKKLNSLLPSLVITYTELDTTTQTYQYLQNKITNFTNDRIEVVRASAFAGMLALKTVDLPNVKTIGELAFESMYNITEINAPMLEELKSNAFTYVSKLTRIDYPHLKTIGDGAFAGIENLTIADLYSVRSIPRLTFNACMSLRVVILRSEAVCTLANTNAFQNCSHILGTVQATYNPSGLKDGYIYVPRALVDSYKAATNWSTYASQFRALEDYTVDGTINGAFDESKI